MIDRDVSVRLLGQVAVFDQGKEIHLGPPHQSALFAALATHVSRVVGQEELIDAVWGASAPPTVRSSVYTYVARLRQTLEPRRARWARSDLLTYDRSGYRLQLDPAAVDALQFQTRLDRATRLRRAGDLDGAVREFDAALTLWQGNPYGGTVGPLAEAERTGLSELRFTAQAERAELLLEVGRQAEVVGELYRLAHRHPYRERMRRLLMTAYLRLGRRVDALTEFRDLRTTLVRDLGIEPSDELQRFHDQILQGNLDPSH